MEERPCSITEIPEDVLQCIWEQVETNEDSLALALTCKQMASHGKKYGFLKAIQYSFKNSLTNCMKNYMNHHDSIRELHISNLAEPHEWFGEWPQKVILTRCSSKFLDVPFSPRLKTLVLKHCDIDGIRFESFPNIERIELVKFDVYPKSCLVEANCPEHGVTNLNRVYCRQISHCCENMFDKERWIRIY